MIDHRRLPATVSAGLPPHARPSRKQPERQFNLGLYFAVMSRPNFSVSPCDVFLNLNTTLVMLCYSLMLPLCYALSHFPS